MPTENGRLPKKVRWFIVTQWNISCDYEELLLSNKEIRYLAYGKEVCTTGRPHHQLFMYVWKDTCHGVQNLNRMGKWFGPTHVTVAPMRGKITENEDYCGKENRGELIKHGNEPKQGARGDLDEAKEQIMKGDMTVDQILVENPGFFHQYGRTLDRLEAVALRQRWRTEMTKGLWYHGHSDVGKSHTIYKGYDPDTHYVKNLSDADVKWWDGYKGQPIVIFNEFRGQIAFSEMLDLMDKWPKTVSWRCKESVPFLAKEIRISSIKPPEEVYVNQAGEPWAQWERRCETIHLKERGQAPGGSVDGPLTRNVKEARDRAFKTARKAAEKRKAAQMEQ